MMGGMNIARHIIDDIFGGTRAVQGVLDDGTPYTTIQSWKDKGSIPAKRQEDLIRKGRAAGYVIGPADFFPPDITRPEAPRDAAAS